MCNLKKSLVALITLLTLYGVEARADSFVFIDVQGSVIISTSVDGGPPILRYGPVYNLSGPGLSVFNHTIPNSNAGSVEARDTCIYTSCTPGQVIGTNSSFSGLISSPPFTCARVNGVYYDIVEITGWLNFVSSPIVLPTIARGDPEVTIPFTFSGELTGDAWHPGVVNPVFTATLSGQGLATFYFTRVGFDVLNPHFRLDYIAYRFEPSSVFIDIKPATFPNSINPKSKGRKAKAASGNDPATSRRIAYARG